MKCPACNADMIKQPTQHNDLWVADKERDGDWCFWDTIIEWHKCSDMHCPMAVYLSNTARR